MDKFTLLDSTYSPKEAKEVILTLIGDKMRFLNMLCLRTREMYSGDTSHLEERIEELKRNKEELQLILDEATEKGMDISLQSEISVKLVESEAKADA